MSVRHTVSGRFSTKISWASQESGTEYQKQVHRWHIISTNSYISIYLFIILWLTTGIGHIFHRPDSTVTADADGERENKRKGIFSEYENWQRKCSPSPNPNLREAVKLSKAFLKTMLFFKVSSFWHHVCWCITRPVFS